ncbi:MAG: hypothetical protein OEM05_10185 [Myxococcales bacterium]|nr:hypothetical protein [Myxococcales bacterium]
MQIAQEARRRHLENRRRKRIDLDLRAALVQGEQLGAQRIDPHLKQLAAALLGHQPQREASAPRLHADALP